MYSLVGRVNIFGYNMMIGMLFAAALNYLHCYFGDHEVRTANFELSRIDMFNYDRYYDEEVAAFQFNFKADIRGLVNWNTNMIFVSLVCEFETENGGKNMVTVWDQRIKREAVEFHQLDLHDEWVEYYLTDAHKSLKGKKVKVYMRWEQMATVGPFYSGMIPIGDFELPDKYVNKNQKRKYNPRPSGIPDNF